MTNIGFIGIGAMAEAIISGMLKAGFSAADIMGADPESARREHMKSAYGINAIESNQELVSGSDVLVLAVKPQYFQGVVRVTRPFLKSDHRVISIMAGVTTTQIEHDLKFFSDGQAKVLPVVRVMPNNPAMVGAGITCVCPGAAADPEDVAFARKIFGSVGSVVDVDEALMDAATGVAGCGPAYVYMLIEAMADGGVFMGLPRQLALRLAADTVRGAAEMVSKGGGHPAQLKDMVCSPGGATIAGARVLERQGFRGAVMEAIIAGAEKCKKL